MHIEWFGFVFSIKRILLNNVSSLNVFYKNKFHAKIFVITVDDKIVFEIIGSSNMTNSAYNGLSSSGFSPNVESDLIIIDETKCETDIGANENTIQFSYSASDNKGITLYERAKSILDYLNNYKKQMKQM